MPLGLLRIRQRWIRWSTGMLLGLVLLCALAMAWVRARLDDCRREWQVEQRALAAMREEGVYVTAGLRPIVPPPLTWLAGPGQARYFDRVEKLCFLHSNFRSAAKCRHDFKYLKWVLVD
jgi:hypothetical protein